MPISLTYDEALLFHHFITQSVSEKARESRILYYAVLCFAARHRGEDRAAETAYERCVTLLIDRINKGSARYDEMML
jgi:hypothetical protein